TAARRRFQDDFYNLAIDNYADGSLSINAAPGAGSLGLMGGAVGVGTLSPTHELTVQSAGTQTLRLINATGRTYGQTAKLNFGDAEYAYIQEDIDDGLLIHSANRTVIDAPLLS